MDGTMPVCLHKPFCMVPPHSGRQLYRVFNKLRYSLCRKHNYIVLPVANSAGEMSFPQQGLVRMAVTVVSSQHDWTTYTTAPAAPRPDYGTSNSNGNVTWAFLARLGL